MEKETVVKTGSVDFKQLNAPPSEGAETDESGGSREATLLRRRRATRRDTRGKLRRVKRYLINFVSVDGLLEYTAFSDSLKEIDGFTADFLKNDPNGHVAIYLSET